VARPYVPRTRLTGATGANTINYWFGGGYFAPAFVPTDLANLKAWYDASDTATITVSGTAVTQWNDKSTNGYNLTQGTAGLRPQSNTRTQNGLNAIDFDGGDDILNASTASDWTFLSNTSGATVFVTAYADAAADGRLLWSTNGGSAIYTGSNGYVQSTDLMAIGTTRAVNGTSAMDVYLSTPSATDNTAFTMTAQFDLGQATASARGYIWKNGASQTNNNTETASASASAPQTPLAIGNIPTYSLAWDGLICEVIMYNAILNATDRGKVETYLAAKWGI
jgi:hypothetical protein